MFRKKSPGGATLMADWPAVVGPALAAVTTPKRLSAGTLTVGCVGPVAMELSHLAPQLIARINAHLGRVTVERLRFVQQAGTVPAAAPRRPGYAVAAAGRGRGRQPAAGRVARSAGKAGARRLSEPRLVACR
ncbi:DUF721 domain-containing protein [Siccirubricoccus deserti]